MIYLLGIVYNSSIFLAGRIGTLLPHGLCGRVVVQGDDFFGPNGSSSHVSYPNLAIQALHSPEKGSRGRSEDPARTHPRMMARPEA